MKFTLVAAIAFIFAIESIAGMFKGSTTKAGDSQSKATAEESTTVKEATINVRWDGAKKVFSNSQVFRIGDQRVCLVMGK